MIKRFLLFQIWIIIILFANAAWCADKISGSACYTYGDNESLVQAEQMTKTLALRNAIESYSTFIESTTKITDFQLSTDLINTISTGQVKKVKVLKRLQSGRKLCYTVEGIVDPNELRSAIKDYLSNKNKSSDVQLQDNGYLKIIGSPFVARTYLRPKTKMEELPFLLEANDGSVSKVEMDQKGINKSDNYIRLLYIPIQFLKYCVASTLPPETNVIDDLTSGRYDSTMPAFRCDYRFKVFVTLYSERGDEIETKGEFIPARFSKSPTGQTLMNKERSPGEKDSGLFYISDDVKSWKVWVPK
jgi:hypothetical protein